MIWLFGVILIVQGVVGLVSIHVSALKKELEDKYLDKVLSTSEQIVLITRDPAIEKSWIRYHNILDVVKAVNLITTSKLYLIINLFITILFLGAWIMYVSKIVVGYAMLCIKSLLRCYLIF